MLPRYCLGPIVALGRTYQHVACFIPCFSHPPPPPPSHFQVEQKPGAYSIPGAGGRTQSDSIPYTVTVPTGVRPGQEFQVMAGGLPMVVSNRVLVCKGVVYISVYIRRIFIRIYSSYMYPYIFVQSASLELTTYSYSLRVWN